MPLASKVELDLLLMRMLILRYLIVTCLLLIGSMSSAQLLSYQLSEAQQEKLTNMWQRSINAANADAYLIVDDYLQRLTNRLAQAYDPPQPAPTVRLIADDRFNAFAALGNFMGINAGLIKSVETEAQLAAIIAHELGHLYAQHNEQQITRQASVRNQSLATFVAGMIISTVNAEAGAAIAVSGQAIAMNKLLAYSRANEREADAIAHEILANAGYPSNSLNLAFLHMSEIGRLNGEPPEWLSTHPSTDSRLAASLRERSDDNVEPSGAGPLRFVQQILAEPERFPDEAFAQAFHQPASEQRFIALSSAAKPIEEDEARITQLAMLSSACEARLQVCPSLAELWLQLRPNDPVMQFALLDYYVATEAWRKGFDMLNKAKQQLEHQPKFWRHYSAIMSNLGRQDDAVFGYAQQLNWQGDLIGAIDYLERQAKRLNRPIYQQWAEELIQANEFD
ncbi:M48 family metallopeptidase [Salinibius halmophilus]|uniref:M48 family metallopeptidase n=1 Tax=Salinibius halmophilus TaxID=1853216 RepID=UPI000E673C6A|nr:M48 family metalloprotease [Salinibius halmophilus]